METTSVGACLTQTETEVEDKPKVVMPKSTMRQVTESLRRQKRFVVDEDDTTFVSNPAQGKWNSVINDDSRGLSDPEAVLEPGDHVEVIIRLKVVSVHEGHAVVRDHRWPVGQEVVWRKV